MSVTTLKSKSYAKINLFLDIHKKMENGYHSITTFYSEINLFDLLTFRLTNKPDFKILSDCKSLMNENNLIYKVGIYIQDYFSVKLGAHVELTKQIPISAGLGGGSSNAATTIKALSELWKLNLSSSEMHDIASKFGSDVNFFLEGYQAIGTGRGEKITPILSDIFIDNILLVNPRFEISAREAYELVSINNEKLGLSYKVDSDNLQNFEYRNDLEPGVKNKYPIIQKTMNLLYEYGAKKVILSGSGPTMIAFFDNTEICYTAEKLIKRLNFWTKMTSTRRR